LTDQLADSCIARRGKHGEDNSPTESHQAARRRELDYGRGPGAQQANWVYRSRLL
jgi:hypothetical protein